MNIVLGVSGGIAAYKAPELIRRLRDAGWDVQAILTPNATRFVSELSIAAVSEHGVITDQWGDSSSGGVDHIEIARWADLLLIAPATANVLAKLATGIADDALTTYAVAHRGNLVVAPAMNTYMLGHPTVRHNLTILRDRGVRIIEPDQGLLACGDEGAGRMPDPEVLVSQLSHLSLARDLEGRRILVTAGPTQEAIDPARYLTNRSSGRMGYAIAAAAKRRGADVTLISGPVSIDPPRDVRIERVRSASEMYEAVMANVRDADVFVAAAAVADYEPVETAHSKIKKEDETITLELRRTRDILAAVGDLSERPFSVGFAAETDDVGSNARVKLEAKRADMIVANDVSRADIGFDAEQNEVTVMTREGEHSIPIASKERVADALWDLVAERLAGPSREVAG